MLNFDFFSPIEEINHPIFKEKNINFFIKRDDLIHPFISGNKWRKLKYNLQLALSSKKTHLVSFGGAYSNHVLALAAAGAKFNFKTTAFIRGEEEVSNEMLSLAKIFGLNVIYTSRENYKNKKQLFDYFFKNDNDAFFIDEGGAGEYAEIGCREIINELTDTYNHIFCAGGTGTTAAGIINQINIKKLDTKFHLVPALKGGSFLRNDISKYLINNFDFEIHEEYHFGGYGKTKPELIDFIQQFASTTGILLDPIYTGKTLFAITDLVKKDYFKENEKVLMIHTGGIFGILGMLNKFK